MKMWPSRVWEFAFLDQVLKGVVEYSEVSTLSMGHSNYNLSTRQNKNDDDGTPYKKTRRGTAKYGERREASQEINPIPEHGDPKKQCTCCGSMVHLIGECTRAECKCHCCGKKGHLKR